MSVKCGKAWLEIEEFQKSMIVLLKVREDISTLQSMLKESASVNGGKILKFTVS